MHRAGVLEPLRARALAPADADGRFRFLPRAVIRALVRSHPVGSTMRPVGRHAGERTRAATVTTAREASYGAPHPPRRRILLLALGLTGTLVAWGVLVFAAIDFGAEARSGGETAAWLLLVLATVGAAACLFVTLLLGARLVTLRQDREQPPPRPIGGRRAAR